MFPETDHDALSFKSSNQEACDKNFSEDKRHAAPAEGKRL
jgi:hypothetical protein